MERNSFNNQPSYESSGKESEDSSGKDKDSSKKKKKGLHPEISRPLSDEKKEQAAERARTLLDKLVVANRQPEESKKETDEKSTEHADEAEVSSEELEAEAEVLSPEEQMEVVAAYAPARIAELKAGRSEQEDPADATAREADIEFLEGLLAEADTTLPQSQEAEDAAGDYELATEAISEGEGPLMAEEDTAPWEDEEPTRNQEGQPVTSPPHQSQSRSTGSPSTVASAGARSVPPPIGNGSRQMPAGYQPLAAPNIYPVSVAEKPGYQPDYGPNPNATYLLVGGIVGYLIGRRRGRIKTEKRMKVVQQKLERQVVEIQNKVAQKEVEVQRQARERYWDAKRAEQRRADRERGRRLEGVAPVRPAVQEFQPSRVVELRAVGERTVRSETLGPQKREVASVEARKTKELTKPQLLETGEKIKVGNTNLKRIFEAKLISEPGLRRLVYEHLDGRDIRRGLAREFLAKELSYERDPRFRDLLPPEVAKSSQQQGGSRAAAAAGDDEESAAAATAASAPKSSQTTHTAGDGHSRRDSRSAQVSNGVLAALTLIALALAIYAVLLALSR